MSDTLCELLVFQNSIGFSYSYWSYLWKKIILIIECLNFQTFVKNIVLVNVCYPSKKRDKYKMDLQCCKSDFNKKKYSLSCQLRGVSSYMLYEQYKSYHMYV